MRLLLVEDDEPQAEHLRRFLQRAGYAVDHADNGEDALFLGQSENYDLIILNWGLPRLSGLQVLKKWRLEGRNVPVLIITARSTWKAKVKALKTGGDDYLTKPFHPEELLVRINTLLRRTNNR